MSEKAAAGAGKEGRANASSLMGPVPVDLPGNLGLLHPPVPYSEKAERRPVQERARRRTFQERPMKSIPATFLRTEEWRLVRGMTEDFKNALLALSRQLEERPSSGVPAAGKVRLILDELNEGLQGIAHLLARGEFAGFLRKYLFREIFPYFSLSRFAQRAYYKPGGYAGDYLMMEMIYHNEPGGNGILGRLIDGWCLNTGAARAVRGRRRFLKDILAGLCEERRANGSATRILNLACGSNREMFDFLSECSYSELITVTGMDGDPRALEYTRRYVDTFAHKASVRLLTDNVVRWAARRSAGSADAYNIIYSAGLTDYLDDRVFTALVKRAHERLSDGGTLIIGNFGYGNTNKAFMDDILEWRLVHRTEADLRRLFRGTGFGPDVEIACEESGVNLFAIATKTLV